MASLGTFEALWALVCSLCCWCKVKYVLAAAAVYIVYLLFKPGARRAPIRPAVSAARTTKRGSGQVIECVSPSTGKRLGECRAFTPDEVKAAYNASKAAQVEWRTSSWTERRALLQDILDWVVDHMDEVTTMSMNDSGKTALEATLGEVMTTCEKIRWIIAHGEGCLAKEERPVPSVMWMMKKAWVEWSPVGVVGIIVPWNYPVHNIFSHVVAALFAGNGALVKVSEFASHSAERVETVFREIIARRGWNPELVQIVTGYAETGQALVKSGAEHILFIGSPQVGRYIMEGASKAMTPVTLELGGKDAFIVFDDCDYNHMLDVAIRGAFINCGQNCVSAERFYIHSKIYDRFVKDIAAKMKTLRQGPSVLPDERKSTDVVAKCCDFGAITMRGQMKIVQSLIDDAKSKGARILSGGGPVDFKECKDGMFFAPTVLADVTHDMKIANEEAFGPVMTIIKFETEQEVIRMANCTKYGLGGSVFTTNYRRAERVASAVETGMISINDFGIVPTIGSLPFGGRKDSGFGAFNGKEGLRAFSYQKSVVTDRIKVRATAPPFLLYPVWPNADLIVQEGLKMVYGRNWGVSVRALLRFLALLVKGRPKSKTA